MYDATVGVVVVAAGTGTRLGSDGPKALVEVAGRSLLAHTLHGLRSAGMPPPIVVHTPGWEASFLAAAGHGSVAELVPGGRTRTDSVRAGVAALDAAADIVVVHDAARPLMPPHVIRAAVEAVCASGEPGADQVLGAAPGLAVADTLKRVEDDQVIGTVDRTHLVGVQTPQVFRRTALARALSGPDQATDDLGLVELMIAQGHLEGRIVVVTGSAWGRKVTYRSDLAVIDALADTVPASAAEEAPA